MTTTTSTNTNTRDWNGLTIPSPGTFTLDLSHSQVGFVARHMMVAKVRGQFTKYTGTIELAEDPLQSKVNVEVEVASIDTRDEARDGHVRSGDFFDVEKFPTLTFASTKVEHRGGSDFAVTGDLTIKGVTKPVTLDVTFEGVVQDPYGNQRLGFSAETDIDRYDYGIEFNAALETGGVVVGRKVKLEIEAETTRTA
jgi:polyisoprenoid-binding protein YceI